MQPLFSYLDLTLLSEPLTEDQLLSLCEKGVAPYKVAALCVPPAAVAFCRHCLNDSEVKIASVFNFPNGNQGMTTIKQAIEKALIAGVDELDVVIPFSKLDALTDLNSFTKIIRKFVAELKKTAPENLLKVIIGTDILREPGLIQAACYGALEGGGDFIKTCTGKGPGVTLAALTEIAKVIRLEQSSIGVKVSGGIKTPLFAYQLFNKAEELLPFPLGKHNFRIGASGLYDMLFSCPTVHESSG